MPPLWPHLWALGAMASIFRLLLASLLLVAGRGLHAPPPGAVLVLSQRGRVVTKQGAYRFSGQTNSLLDETHYFARLGLLAQLQANGVSPLEFWLAWPAEGRKGGNVTARSSPCSGTCKLTLLPPGVASLDAAVQPGAIADRCRLSVKRLIPPCACS